MLPLLFAPASRQKPHQVQQDLYPSAITGGPVTACRCPLNGTFAFRLSRSNRVSNASPKPSSICACTSLSVSELLHKVNLYHSLCRRSMTATASQPASKKSSGDFPVVRCTHVLSSSMSFPYGKIVTHFRWFVNGEFRYCITFSSACTSTATPSGTQWLSASFLLPCSPQKGSYRFRLSGISPSPSSTSSSLSGKVLLPESAELSRKPEIQLPAFYEFLPYILHTK